MIRNAGRELRSEHGVINIAMAVGPEDTRAWEALRVLASIIVRARQGVDSSGDTSLHGTGDST